MNADYKKKLLYVNTFLFILYVVPSVETTNHPKLCITAHYCYP